LRDRGMHFAVEPQFELDKASKSFAPRELRMVADEGAQVDVYDVARVGYYPQRYWAALRLALEEAGTPFVRRMPRKRPKPGHPLDLDFYRRVLDARDELERRGHPSPDAELARRMKENPSTVRGWIHRARKHIREEGDT
jgi:hypothetical protein